MNTTFAKHAGTLAGFGTDVPTGETAPDRAVSAAGWRAVNGAGVWSRVGLLFLTLCLIKAAIILDFRKYLFEIHWRVSGQPYNWANRVAFYAFAALVGANLWTFAARCLASGARRLRLANACVLALGAAFIFLTFHEGDKDYVHPVLHGILKWQDIGWYLALNFCFRQPYLAAWLLGYALIYYGMARTGRERFMLRITAVGAAAYTALNLRGLMAYHDGLIVADAVGLACLALARYSTTFVAPTRRSAWPRGRAALPGSPALRPVILPFLLLLAASMFLLFRSLDPMVTLPASDFLVITGLALALVGGVSLLAWRRSFFASWSWVLPFALVTFLVLTNINYPLAANYQNLLCLGLTLPRYFLGEFELALALGAAAWLYRRWRPAGSLWWLDAVNLALIVLALVDLRLSQIMGVRLDWDVVTLATGETPRMMWRMSRPYLPVVALLLAGTTALYAGALWGVRRLNRRRVSELETRNLGSTAAPAVAGRASPPADEREGSAEVSELVGATGFSARPRKTARGPRALPFNEIGRAPRLGATSVFALLSFALLALAGHWFAIPDKADGETAIALAESSPLWQRTATPVMDRRAFLRDAGRLGMVELTHPQAVVPAGKPRDWNVVLIFQESSYNKYLSLFDGQTNTQPLLSKYKDRMELFPNFFSSFAGSINARFATFTGLYPVKDYRDFTEKRVDVKSLFEILHDHGYVNSLFYSSYFDYTGFRDFLRDRDIDVMYDADTMPQRTEKVSWGVRESETLRAIRSQIQQYAATGDKFCLTYVPAAPHNPFDGTPERFRKFRQEQVGDFRPRYLNELLYMDWVISSIVDQLQQSGLLNHTLVVITDDHGEMLGGPDGAIGHGWRLTPRLANVPLIIMDPARRGYRVNDTVGSQVDVLPTILDLLRLPMPAGQLCQGDSLYSPAAAADRTIYLNTFQQYGILKGGELVCGDGSLEAQGRDALRRCYEITNRGARTFFTETDATNVAVPKIAAFDSFQENFLRNYPAYCQEAPRAVAVR